MRPVRPRDGPTGHRWRACLPAGRVFATDNTTDGFELPAVATIALTGTVVTGSTLVDGVFWSNERQQIGYERSREFHLCVVDAPTLHNAAEALHRQFNQEAVLTFDYLPQNAPEADAILITVPDIGIARFRDAFASDLAAHHRLRGGSVTTADHTLILAPATAISMSPADSSRRPAGTGTQPPLPMAGVNS
ncbi:membrane protein [Mycobacterium tuberculosis]|nr:membrane protein [Mycobacterium tuberculosis]